MADRIAARDSWGARLDPERPAEHDHSDAGVDRTLIRWMLGLTPEQRLEALQGFVDSVRELRGDRP